MKQKQISTGNSTSWLSAGAALAAIGASACCVGPLLLLSLGISGAWISTLTSMTAVRPFFFALSLLFIWLGFMKLYLSNADCKEGDACVSPKVRRNQRIIFWVGTIAILLLLSFPWVAPSFM